MPTRTFFGRSVRFQRSTAAGDHRIWGPTGPHTYTAVGDEVADAVLVMRHPARPVH